MLYKILLKATIARNYVYRILVGNPEGKRPLETPGRRWIIIIKMDLREIGWDGMEWIDLAQDRDRWRALVDAVGLCLIEC
jgi:hypothetical protein